MKNEDRYDQIIRDMVARHFPELLQDLTPFGWLWVKAQIWQESRMDPLAVSPAGAQGLMQLMPATDKEIDGELDGFDVSGNVEDGVKYLAEQYRKLAEIPTHLERIRFALASYNGGRGYINFALVMARDDEGLPGSYTRWSREGRPPGLWQMWEYTKPFLADPRCRPGGRRPDYQQMWDYVAKIEARYNLYMYRKMEA